jgi:hypothetical protein
MAGGFSFLDGQLFFMAALLAVRPDLPGSHISAIITILSKISIIEKMYVMQGFHKKIQVLPRSTRIYTQIKCLP